MKRFFLFTLCLSFSALSMANHPDLKANFKMGNPEIQSINALAFGPEGILFIGDAKQAQVVALDTEDNEAANTPEKLNFKNVDEHIAALLGTTTDAIQIRDMAINPVSKNIYLAIHTQDATPILLRYANEKMEVVALDKVSYNEVSLQKPVAADAKDRRGRSLRQWAISDLAYQDGEVMVSGLSNEEFSSAFVRMAFPFNQKEQLSSIEIYHAAHGRYETYAPIKTFMPFDLNGEKHIVASYTCTPLVIFPVGEMEAGKHLKGNTVAELGNRNTPLDIISYKKGEKTYLLLANTTRALMKIDPEKVASYNDFLTEKVAESSGTAGVDFIALPMVNVQQMDKFDDEHIVFLQRNAKGELNLFMGDTRRL